MNFKNLIENSNNEFIPPKVDFIYLSKIRTEINDEDYYVFISEKTNGGFFFDNSLHLYGSCTKPEYHSIESINNFIHNEFKELTNGLLFFGQDIFGNQFGFDKSGIVLFNIETGEKEFIAKNFMKWIEAIYCDVDFFTGQKIIKQWKAKKQEIFMYDQRLCPKKPFVIGGEYEIINLYSQRFPLYISSNANIANQIHNLADGTDVKIITTE